MYAGDAPGTTISKGQTLGPSRVVAAVRQGRSVSRRAGLGALGVLLLVTLSACSSEQLPTFAMPVRHATDKSPGVLSLWQGSWIAALTIGAITWGLILWPVLAHRRKRGASDLPPQTRYNLPIEVFYTAVPVIMIAVFFYFTARDESRITALSGKPSHKITVNAIRWSWQFSYVSDAGPKTTVTGTPGKPPTLVLPEGESVQFLLHSNDVIHSFWVPAWLYKMDVIPGRSNTFEITPKQLGRFRGKCAELCGRDHSRMLFNVKVVSPADYQAYLTRLKTRLAQGGAQ